jgi:hypothetical protein
MNRYRTILATLGGFLPQTQSVIDRAILEGYNIPNETTLKELDLFIGYCISEGIFNVLDYLRVSAYNDLSCENFSKINICRPNGDLISYVIGGTSSINYTINGVKLNSSSSNYAYLNSGVVIDLPSSVNFYSRNNASRGTVLYQATSGAFTSIINGVLTSTAERMSNENTVNQRITQTTNNLPSSLDLTGTGLKALSRLENTVLGVNKDVVSTYTRTFFASNINYGVYTEGASFNVGSGMGTSMGFLGGYLTQSQVLNLRTAYNTYLTNIGLTPIA